MAKDSFIIYKSFYEPIKSLSDKQLGRLFRALFDYQLDKSMQVDADIQMAFSFFKNQMDIDEEKYQKVVERNKQNGLNGGRPTKEKNPNNPVGLQKPKKPYNDNENVNDDGNENEKFNKKIFRDQLVKLGADPQHVNDWISVRDRKKASFTKTAFNRFLKECTDNKVKIPEAVRVCAERGWQGFKYEWAKDELEARKSPKKGKIENNEW